MKKILITGGSGFIGLNLCKKLLNEGNIIYCLDDFSSSDKQMYNPNSNLHQISHDIRKPIDLYDIDQIYNLASPAAPNHYRKDPLKTLETNIYGTKNILDLATKLNIPLLHVSSIRIFDTSNHLGNNSCYTEGKRVSETLCREYALTYWTQVNIARLNSVYGPGMRLDDSRVIPQFIMKSLKNEELNICGDGSDIETFCYIDDALDILTRFITAPHNGSPLNIDGFNITLIDLANLIIELTHSSSKIKFDGISRGKHFKIEGANIREIIEWSPVIGMREGLISVINYYKNIISEIQ